MKSRKYFQSGAPFTLNLYKSFLLIFFFQLFKVSLIALRIDIPSFNNERLLFGQIVEQWVGRWRFQAGQGIDGAHPFFESYAWSFLQRYAALVAWLVVDAPESEKLEQTQ